MPQCSGACKTVANKTNMLLHKMRRVYVVVPIERHMELCTPPTRLNGVRPEFQNVVANANEQVRNTSVHVAFHEDSVQVRDAESAVDSHVTQKKAIAKHDLVLAHVNRALNNDTRTTKRRRGKQAKAENTRTRKNRRGKNQAHIASRKSAMLSRVTVRATISVVPF